MRGAGCQYGGDYPYCDPPPLEFENAAPPPEQQPCDVWAECGGSGGGGGDPGGSEPDPDENQPTPCQTDDAILNSTAVQRGMDSIWKASNPTAAMADRRERGGWIIRDALGQYRVEPFPDGWTIGACGIDAPASATPPFGTVAWIHTHPYSRGDPQTACDRVTITIGGQQMQGTFIYLNDPSDYDGRASQLWNVPGYVLDHDVITTFVGDASSADEYTIVDRTPACGYSNP